MKYGRFFGEPGVLRMSTVLRRCREQNMSAEVASEVQRVAALYPECPTHGPLADPIIGRTDSQIAIICPWCSDPEVLAAWEAEGGEVLA